MPVMGRPPRRREDERGRLSRYEKMSAVFPDHRAHSGRRARSGGAPEVGSYRLIHRPSPRRRRGMGPGLSAMAITQIHTHRRNHHGSWRDGEGGALDALRRLGYCSEWSHRRELIQRSTAAATLRLPGALQPRRRPVERGAGGLPQRQREAHRRTRRSLSPRQWPVDSKLCTRSLFTHASRTINSHRRTA